MYLRIQQTNELKLIGMHQQMCFAKYNPFELWSRFMPRNKEIINRSNSNLYSIEIYNDINFFRPFNPETLFTKWAAVEVNSFESIPGNMESLIIPSGQYAVFLHKGPAANASKTYNFIFTEWFPGSEYTLDNRPHFAVMDDKYKKDDPASEEEIFIPVFKKQ